MPLTKLSSGATAGTATAGYTLAPSLSRGTYYTLGGVKSHRVPRPHGLRELEYEFVTLGADAINPPSTTLAGITAQLAQGDRLDFSPELRNLAREAIARQHAPRESTDEWAARLASEAAGIFD